MSSSNSKVAKCPPRSQSSADPVLADRIQRFQSAVHDLLAILVPEEKGSDAPTLAPRPAGGETRCWYYPSKTLQQERELLHRYRVDDFRGLLTETHKLLIGLIRTMKSTRHDVRVKGHVIVSLGHLLEQVAALVQRMKTVYEQIEIKEQRPSAGDPIEARPVNR